MLGRGIPPQVLERRREQKQAKIDADRSEKQAQAVAEAQTPAALAAKARTEKEMRLHQIRMEFLDALIGGDKATQSALSAEFVELKGGE